MPEDIRDKTFINHEDVVGLNFIKGAGPYIFRRHYRQGLRSHILEVLRKADVERETSGIAIDGTRWFPQARPVRMFRIFRSRLKTRERALKEVERVKIVERYLAPEHLAGSNEFIVDYRGPEGWDLMLCGFQEYVDGEIIDPWSILGRETYLPTLYGALRQSVDAGISKAGWVREAQIKATVFLRRIKRMISQSGYVPDLAGIGNLVVDGSGEIKLVDINNISRVVFDASVHLDDREYPVCDKSIEALFLLEEKMCGKPADVDDPLYRVFLNPERRKEVKARETHFYRKRKYQMGYPPLQR